MRASRLALLTLLATLGLAGCGLAPGGDIADSTPPPISASAVPDAVPRPDPILPQGNTSPYTVNGQTYSVLTSAAGYVEEGIASWYGLKFHGRATANGERFSVYQATAAHRSLPIPSYARVTRLDTGAEVIVRVNDRGPFHSARLIDLSYGAAVRLGFAELGTARVRVEVIDVAGVDDRRAVAGGQYRQLQLGAFADIAAAEALRGQVADLLSIPVAVSAVDTAQGRLHRLRAGPFANEGALRAAQAALRGAGLPEGQPLP